MEKPKPKIGIFREPRLFPSIITNRVFIVTRYRDRGNGILEALQKYDATEDFEAIMKMRLKSMRKRKKAKGNATQTRKRSRKRTKQPA